MSTFNGWTVVTMPTTGPSPKSIEMTYQSIVGVSSNPFSGQQQIQDWQAHWLEMNVTMPPMAASDAANWYNFLISLDGMANVFQITDSTWLSLIPAAASVNGYWRLKTNPVKFSINDGIIYGFQFELREAI
jgi:hypothetical protein